MALLSNLIVLCNRKGKAVKDVRIGHVEVNSQAAVRAPVRFNGGAATTERTLAEERGEFADYAGRKAARLATALDQNPNLTFFLGRLVEAAKNYAAYHEIPYHRLRVDGAIIDRNNTLFMRLTR
jgi:hypothetical protein